MSKYDIFASASSLKTKKGVLRSQILSCERKINVIVKEMQSFMTIIDSFVVYQCEDISG